MREFNRKVENKEVALVGNATSIFGQALGDEIDNCDVVIRMNAGIIKEPVSQGRRTDILVTSLGIPVEKIGREFRPAIVVWATSKRRLIPRDYRRQGFTFLKHPLWIWAMLRWQLGSRPSTGAIAANYLYNWAKPSSVKLFGFDHFQSGTYYHDREDIGPHNPQAERVLFQRWKNG